jgi:serine/threonine protein kinase
VLTRPRLASDRERPARFEREAKLLATLNHAHIASIYGLDEDDGTLFRAMELIEGATLEEKLKAGPLPVDDALRIGLQNAEALEAAHDKGVVHRDLKPANIMLSPDGVVNVLDFDILMIELESGEVTQIASGTDDGFPFALPWSLTPEEQTLVIINAQDATDVDIARVGQGASPVFSRDGTNNADDYNRVDVVLNWFEELRERVPTQQARPA